MNNKKNIHWFDLDGTLIETNAKWWIIDKNNPDKYIIKISPLIGSLILTGFYKSDNNYIKYNGQEGWLSNDLISKINKNKTYKLEDLGLSWREYTDSKLIENQVNSVLFYLHNIKHLNNTTDIVNLITTRGNKEAHNTLLYKLNKSLLTLNININDEYFVNDFDIIKLIGDTSTKKCLIILQNIIGYKIQGDKFVPISIDKYDTSYFYDDEDKNIDTCLLINNYLSIYLSKTMTKLKDIILKDIKERKPILYTNLVTSNTLNPFITKEIKIVGL